MSAIASKSLDTRDSLLRTIVLGGMFIFIAQFLPHLDRCRSYSKEPVYGSMAIYRQRRTGHGRFRGQHRHRLTRGALSLDHLPNNCWRLHRWRRPLSYLVPLCHRRLAPIWIWRFHCHAPDRNTAQCDATVTGANHPVASRGDPRTYLTRRIAARNSRAAPC